MVDGSLALFLLGPFGLSCATGSGIHPCSFIQLFANPEQWNFLQG